MVLVASVGSPLRRACVSARCKRALQTLSVLLVPGSTSPVLQPLCGGVHVSLRPREIAISPVRIISIEAERPDHRLKRLDLLRRPRHLDDQRALGHVDDLAAEDVGDLHQLPALSALGERS